MILLEFIYQKKRKKVDWLNIIKHDNNKKKTKEKN